MAHVSGHFQHLGADGPCLAVRFVGAFYVNQKFHGGNCRDGGIINAKYSIHVKLAALDRDQNAGVEDNSPGHARHRPARLEIAHIRVVFASGPVANAKEVRSSIPGGNVGF